MVNNLEIAVKKHQSGKILYLILWSGTTIIGVVMMLMGYEKQLKNENYLKNPEFTEQTSSGETINNLFLSADDLTIEEKKSFINLRQGDDKETATYQGRKEKREEVYKKIFQRKIGKLNGKSTSDFSIKPVPKQ
jgi:hypothetical protein